MLNTENRFPNSEEDLSKDFECPNCGSNDVITDQDRGEKICSNCGFVIEDRMIDFSTDWRAYNQEEYEKKARAEAPSSIINHDLSTYIGLENTDALGKPISGDKRIQFYRLINRQFQIRNQYSKDRNLKKANQELERLCSQLEVSRNVKETAGLLYKKSFEAGAVRGYPIDSMIAASVYAAARIRRVPRTLDEISNSTQISAKRVAQCYRIIVTRMKFRIPPTKPMDFLTRMSTELGLSTSVQQLAVEIITGATNQKLTIGKDPIGLAAAALYLSGIIKNEKRPQQLVAKVSHTTEVTIRHRFKELLRALGDKISMQDKV